MTSLKFIGIRFAGFWNLPLMASVLCAFAIGVALWNRPTRAVVGEVWARRLFFLRILAGLVLLLFVFNPTLIYRQTSRSRGQVAVIIDTSKSMERRDSAGGLSRIDSVKKVLGGSGSFSDELEKYTDVAYFTFDSEVHPLPGANKIPSLSVQGDATDLGGAFGYLAQKRPQGKWAGAVIFSDGAVTVPGSPLAQARALGCPIYAVGVGKKISPDTLLSDIGIVRIQTNPWTPRNQTTPIRIAFKQSGFAGEIVNVRLEEEGKKLLQKSVTITPEKEQDISLEFLPRKKGLRHLRIVIPLSPRDAIPENNSVEFSLLVTDAKLKLLYAEGSLRWEYKFIRRTLSADPYIEPTFLIRTTPDRAYQQEDGKTLTGGFPDSPDALAKFDCLILGDIPRAFLSDKQLAAIEAFAAEKGGGVIVAGGFNTLCADEYADTPLAKLLPVKLIKRTRPIVPIEYTPIPDVRSVNHELLTGLLPEITKRKLQRWYPVGKPKVGAEVLLRRRTKSGADGIVLATQTYGKGRILLIATDELWRWSFNRKKPDEAGVAERLYLQAARWVAKQTIGEDKTAPLFLARLDSVYYTPKSRATLTVRWNNARLAGNKPEFHASLIRHNKTVAKLDFPQTASRDFVAHFSPSKDGCYEVRITGSANKETQTQTLKFIVGRPYRESESIALNETLLRAIAEETRGGYYSLLNVSEIVKRLQSDEHIEQNRIEKELAGGPGWFLLFITLTGLEWYLRRRKGLM